VEWAENRVVVTDSADSLVRRGDVIRSIDGRSTNAVVDSIMSTRSGAERYRRSMAIRQSLRGDSGSAVRLDIERQGKTRRVMTSRPASRALKPRSPGPVTQIEAGIWYVDLDRSRATQIDSAMAELAVASAVIFDARGYPNGTHGVLAHLADTSIQSPTLRIPRIVRPDWSGAAEWHESTWSLPPVAPRIRGRVVFLMGSGSVSACENLLGMVENHRLGELVGESTAGCNGTINEFVLPGGTFVRWTGMRVLKPDGSEHHRIGIRPTVPVTPTIAGIRAGKDEVLERGLAIARGEKALRQ